jgi:hypothetical protein
MPTTFTKIASATVGSGGAATIDFTSIPSTYTDLVVKLSARSNNTSVGVYVNYNGNSANYASLRLYADGATTYSDTHGSAAQIAVVAGVNISTFTASTFSSMDFYIPNYAGSNNKSASSDSVTENNATTAWAALGANLWSNSAAITSIALTPAAGSFVQYSTATLYGIKNS